MGNEISNNTASHGPLKNVFGRYINLYDSQNVKICDNYDNAILTHSYWFQGNCNQTNLRSNTSIVNTNFDNNVRLSAEPVIGTQIHKGNKWSPSTNAVYHPTIEFVGDPSTAFLSRFTVHTNQSVLNGNQYSFFSEYFPAKVVPVSVVNQLFATNANGLPQSGCNDPSPLVGGEDQTNDPLIAKNGLADYFSSPARPFDLKKQLYGKIKKNSTAFLNKNIYKDFMTKSERENIGKSFDIERLIFEDGKMDALTASNIKTVKGQLKALDEEKNKYDLKNKPNKAAIEENYKKRVQYKNDLDNHYKKYENDKKIKLKEAKRIIDNFTATTTNEGLVKDVYQIYLDVQLNQNGQTTTAQIDRLKKIASICPSVGGQIVYIARGFLTEKDLLDIKDAIAVCEPNEENRLQAREASSEPIQETQTKAEFVIYPNPSQEAFDINLSDNESGMLQMTDLLGKIVNTVKLKTGTNNIRHNLPNGLYLINIKTDKGKLSTQKLIVRQ